MTSIGTRSTFKQIEISGTPLQRGISHGKQMREEIAQALPYYKNIFKLSNAEILQRAKHFRTVIKAFSKDYAQEIEGIAQGAEIEPLWIYALNARTEILALNTQVGPNECTSMCFPETTLLGQTWDWGKPLENLCALMRISRPDGHKILMLSEPGIIGKIGMNNAGLGVCLNILTCNKPLDGLPIHVMLRAILDCSSTAQARKIIASGAAGKASNVIVADATGDCFDLEFSDETTYMAPSFTNNFIHTNHYLGKNINDLSDPFFANSQARLTTAKNHIAQRHSSDIEGMKAVISDRTNTTHPIYRPYIEDENLKNVGTVASFVMDLKTQTMHIRKGNADGREFHCYSV